MPTPVDATYVPNAKFILEIDDIAITSFEKVTMGDSEWGILDGRTGTDPLYKITSSGIKTPSIITIEKHLRDSDGISDIKPIITWHQAGSKDRRSGAIVVLDREDKEQIRFEFRNGWVSKFTPPELDASQENNPSIFAFEISIGEFTVA